MTLNHHQGKAASSTLVANPLTVRKESMSSLTRMSMHAHLTEKRIRWAAMARTTPTLSGAGSRPSPVRSKPRRARDIGPVTIGMICHEIRMLVPIRAHPARTEIIRWP